MRVLNRCLEWRSDGLYYEPDPRQAEIIIEQMGVEKKIAVVTLGIKTAPLPEEEDLVFKQEYATTFRRIIARASFLAQDRVDIQYAVKETAKGMANPEESDWDKLVRIEKCLLRSLNCFGDSDFAHPLGS